MNDKSELKSLDELRDDWIAAENGRVAAYRAFMGANRNSPLRKQLDEAENMERAAKDAYRNALQKQNNESPPDATPPRLQAAD